MSDEKDILTFEIKSVLSGNLACTYDARPVFDYMEKRCRFILDYLQRDGSVFPYINIDIETYIKTTNNSEESTLAVTQEARAKEFIEKFRELLLKKVKGAVEDALFLLANDEVPAQILSELQETEDHYKTFLTKRLQRNHLFLARERMNSKYETRGRKPGWNKSELKTAVVRTLNWYHKKHYRAPTLRDMANALNERYPNKPKFSSDTLRKFLDRYELDWKAIKKRNK